VIDLALLALLQALAEPEDAGATSRGSGLGRSSVP